MREISERERERYQRNLLVDGFGEQGQSRLLESRVTVVGAGGLGSAVLNYLVAAGVGHIRIVESDTVSPSNLQRQVLYTTAEIGALKAEAAAARLSRLNPGCRLEIVAGRLTAADASERLHGSDVVVDCTDNYAARYVIDDYCASAGVPMVYGTAEQAGGQVSVFHARGAGGYRSLYPEEPPQEEIVGVLSPVVGVIGSLQALETVKLLSGFGETLAGRLLVLEGRTMRGSIFEI